MRDFLRKPMLDDAGATAIEYALLACVIAMALFFGMNAFTTELIAIWQDIEAHSPATMK